MVRRGLIALLAVGCMAAASLSAANAEDAYPTKPIKLVVPFGPGSTADILARIIGKTIELRLGQPVIVDNRPGAGGVIGADIVAKAPPDGYTLVLGTVASHSINASLMAKIPYDVVKDFDPITLIVNAPNLLVVHSSVPATTMAEFVAYVRQQGEVSFASAGIGTTSQLALEYLKVKAGINLNHVPYKAAGQALNDLVAGEVKVMVYQVPALLPHIESGALRPIAMTSAQRVSVLPNVPTVAESYMPGFDFSAWFGMFAPAHTPRAIIEKLHGAILAAMQTSELKEQLSVQGLEPVGMDPDRFRDLVKADVPKWAEVIKVTGARID